MLLSLSRRTSGIARNPVRLHRGQAAATRETTLSQALSDAVQSNRLMRSPIQAPVDCNRAARPHEQLIRPDEGYGLSSRGGSATSGTDPDPMVIDYKRSFKDKPPDDDTDHQETRGYQCQPCDAETLSSGLDPTFADHDGLGEKVGEKDSHTVVDGMVPHVSRS